MIKKDEILGDKDFNKPIFETSTKLAKIIVQDMLENFDLFMEGYDELSEEQRRDLYLRRIDYAGKLLMKMSTTDIPADYASFSIEKVKLALTVIESVIEDAITKYYEEILARTVGVKSPLDGGFNKEYATLKDVIEVLSKTRKEIPGEFIPFPKPKMVAKKEK